MNKEIYMDVASSTNPSHEVIYKLNSTILKSYANPSSAHEAGRIAKGIIKEASDIIANKLNCKSNEIHYTSGATMSNNIAIQGFIRANKESTILYSSVEHNDIIDMCDWISENTNNFTRKIPVNRNGLINIEMLVRYLQIFSDKHSPVLVSIQMANSESGVIQDIKKISEIVHLYPNCYFHTDATQYIPYYNIDVEELGIDMLSMSGQKIHGIKGTGLLYVKEGTPILPLIFGEQGLIGGTENVYGIATLGEAFKHLDYSRERYTHLLEIRSDLLTGLSVRNIDMKIVGTLCTLSRLPNNLYVCFKGVNAEQLVELLSERGIYVSAGSACSSGSMKPSHVALAYGLSEDDAKSCIRFTVDENITHEDIVYVADTIKVFIDMIKK